MRLIGHRDLMRCLERVFRRAGLALGFSQGFHPKPRMTFPSALAVGIEGLDEVMEVELAEAVVRSSGFSRYSPPEGGTTNASFSAAEELLRRLAPQAPPGLTFRAVEVLPEGGKKVRLRSAAYEASIPAPEQAGLAGRIDALLAAGSWPVERARGRAPVDLRPLVLDLALSEGLLAVRLRLDGRQSASVRDVLAALGLAGIEQQGARLRRTAVEVAA